MLLLASSVFAQDYVKVDENTSALFYVDKSSIVKEKNVVKFKGRVEAKAFISTTDFVTDCKSYTVLFELFETTEEVLTRQRRKLTPVAVQVGSPLESAIKYACYGTIKKDTARGTIPQAG